MSKTRLDFFLFSMILFVVIFFSMPLFAADAISGDYYVSPKGNDANPGTLDKPFASLQKARDVARGRIASGLDKDIVISLRQGRYQLEKEIVFGPEDGGNAEYAVTYAAYPGEKPVLSGGRLITGWQKGKDGMWTLKLNDVKNGKWWFRQLYADGQYLARGRYPETGFLRIKKRSNDFKGLQFKQPLPDGDLGGQDTEVVVIENWSIAREIIVSSTKDSIKSATQIGWVGHGSCLPKPGQAAFLENALEFVTKPGQWYLDRSSGILHYKAAQGENPNKRQFLAPVAQQLIKVEGTREKPVRNLHFKGIEFAHVGFLIPEIGYAGIQACYNGTTTEDAITYCSNPAVEISQAFDCGINQCRFILMGGNSLGLGAGARRNTIVGCEFADIGANGPMVGYMPIRNPLWTDWANPADVPINNEISNCYIHDCGVELYGAVGIFDAMANGTRIIHNELTNLPYGGISVGYVWNTLLTSQRNTLVAYNHVHDIMERLYDSGAVYTLGYQPGSVICGNLLHGVRRSNYAFGQAANNGIFFDEGSKEFLLEDNIIFDISEKPIRFNRSSKQWQTWRNNTFDITPDMDGYLKKTAEKAGLQPRYRKFLKSSN